VQGEAGPGLPTVRVAAHADETWSRGSHLRPALNPFSTRYIRPGALTYRFPPGQSADRLLAVLRDHAGWGEIVGPHGSGKTTLVETLIRGWRATGGSVITYRLHDRQRHLPPLATKRVWPAGSARLVVVDGYEQLGLASRWQLKRRLRRTGTGLLVTSHRPTGLPHLCHTGTDLATVLALVTTLTTGTVCPVRPAHVIASFARHQGNVREILFDLYHVHERTRHPERTRL